MRSRIFRLFNGLILYILFLLTFHIPVAEESLFLHQTQACTGIMYVSHIFLWGDSLVRRYTSRTTIFHVFSNNYPTAFIYHVWIPAVISICVWRINMALRTYIWNVHEVEVLVTISVNVVFFVYIPGMICMMRCIWYVSVVALKVKKASSALNRGIPTKNICVYIFECPRSRTEVWKPRLVMPGTWCRVWFIFTCMWYLVHNT